MLSKPLSDKEIQAAFDRFVKDPGGGVPSDAGFDSKTEAALFQVMMDPTPLSIANARKELALQLNGTHAKKDAADIEALIAERIAKKQG